MDNIIIRVADLYDMARKLQKAKMTFVQISLLDAEDDQPASISFSGIPYRNCDYDEDFGDIEESTEVLPD